MRSRVERISARGFGFGLSLALGLFGSTSACDDDRDGSDATSGAPSAGNGGAPVGGAGASSGGRSGSGGAGGSSTAAGSGGTGMAVGGMQAGGGEGGSAVGGTDAGAGEGGVSPPAGNGGVGMGGDAGSASPPGGAGGFAPGGTGGEPAGAGGGTQGTVEYRSCRTLGGVTRITLNRIDREGGTCTSLQLRMGETNCLDDLKSDGWCVERALVSPDVEACESFNPPSGSVEALGGEGTFSVSAQPLTVDIDMTFEFPASGSLPTAVAVEATDCAADCVQNDCRP